MKNIVITGGTRGIGFHLAGSFLELGCQVVISGRKKDVVTAAVGKLWDFARKQFGKVDIWINNAGISASMKDPWEYTVADIEAGIRTNIIGTMFGTGVAVKGMLKQGGGAVYSLEGLGSQGRMKVKGLSLYGTTKAALRYFNDSLFADLKGKPVIAGAIRPGMVLTDLITSQYADNPKAFEKFKPILNILAERPEVVAPVLTRKILANTRNGACIRYGSSLRTFGKFLTLPFKKPNQK
jgi:NAD(P)-dependent dehydrogenase (short-subunit alcohol dehydrogenase family)